MANALYPLWKEALLAEASQDKGLDQPDAANGLYAAFLTIGPSGYTYSPAHQFYTDLTNIQGTSQQITNPTVTGGVVRGDPCLFLNVDGTEIGAIVIYRRNAYASSTWRLVLYLDTGIVGFPIIPSGGNIQLTWNLQAQAILKL